ncbi:thiolase family protein [Dethiosulfovibrio sp. F2B]|uniref:thiolase family protein n=1 Tax=Dethiosulfovibrio faecalis TaxID=2720018 RepID=UPI001F1615B2|nr:thiolase family protein [Dethiosulfovibrio faecalis]MCF4151589.1 thiolase family protein [Dethiosulfovibrio faecalis]
MGKPVILSACRTPGGKYGGSLSKKTAPDLGAIAIAEAIRRSGVSPDDLGEVIMGNGWQAGVGANPARIAMYRAGVPSSIPAFTVNKRCGSSVKTAMLIADRIRLGDIKAGVAGGMESASNVPFLLEGARWGYRMGDKTALDGLHRDGFMCPLAGMMMGATGEILAEENSISREEQDGYALGSHRKAVAAIESGAFREEIVPVTIKDRKKGEITVDTDEIPRADTSLEKLAKLPPVFRKDGTISAGSSSALCDAGSAMVIADEDWARANGYEPLAEILGYSPGALDAEHMGLGPTVATPKALEMAGLKLEDMDLIELNEAFAVQVLAVHRNMPFDMDRCNVFGGAIALGHPIGATGAKLIATLVHGLRRRDQELGLVTACIGGGQGVAMVLKRL